MSGSSLSRHLPGLYDLCAAGNVSTQEARSTGGLTISRTCARTISSTKLTATGFGS